MAQRGWIAVVSDHALCRQGTAELLRTRRRRVVAAETFAQARGARTIVVDLDHAPGDTRRLVQALTRLDAHVVLMGTPERLAAVEPMPVVVETPEADAGAVMAAISGRKPRTSAELARKRRLWRAVTPRQLEVLRWLAVGRDNRAIAHALGVGERTIKGHVTVLLVVFSAESRTELALIAARAGLRPRG